MKKKIVILVIVVGLVAFVILSNFTSLGVFFDYSELAIFNSKILCKIIPNSFESNKCFKKIAMKRKNENICEEIKRDSKPKIAEEFRSDCYWSMAIVKKDLLLCDKATFHKNWCIRSIASSIGDESLCDRLPKKEDRGSMWETYRESCEREVERVRELNSNK